MVNEYLTINTFAAQLLLWGSYFLGISNYSEHILLQKHDKIQQKLHKNISNGNVIKATTKCPSV